MIGEIAAARSLGKRRLSHPPPQPHSLLCESASTSANSGECDGTASNTHEELGKGYNSIINVKDDLNSSIARQHDALVAMGMYESSDNIKDAV